VSDIVRGAATREQILVLDDDEMVREAAVRQLTSLGYRVVSASTGTEALEVLGRVGDIDLLFSDLVMPGEMGGREVAEKAKRICPGLKVLFSSGYVDDSCAGDGTENLPQIVKPYRKKDLAEKILEVLGSTAG